MKLLSTYLRLGVRTVLLCTVLQYCCVRVASLPMGGPSKHCPDPVAHQITHTCVQNMYTQLQATVGDGLVMATLGIPIILVELLKGS
jgi:hypothetical protein